MDIEKLKGFDCPLEATLAMIGGKYKILIVYFLINQTLRYSELQKLLPQASPKMLAQQLKELERDGLVHRELYPVVPPKTEYSLTERGKSLAPIILAIYQWGEQLFVDAGLANPCREEDMVRMKEITEESDKYLNT